jgi:APA family basic amino acid/polyamine antiporter
VQLSLGITVVLYAVIGVAVLSVLGPDELAGTTVPLAAAVDLADGDWAVPVVRAGGAAAALGALLGLIAGIGRTTLAMAREGDLPAWLAAVHPRFRVPHHAELTLALVVCMIVLTVDLRGAIAFSSFGVLLYYLVANVAAYTQVDAVRRFPRSLQVLGGIGCVVLVATLPPLAVATGVAVFAVGTGYRLSRVRGSRLRGPAS